MSEFEITISRDREINIDVTDKKLYSHDFNSYSLVPLQEHASFILAKKIKNGLFSHISEEKLIRRLSQKGRTEYVAKFSAYAEKTKKW